MQRLEGKSYLIVGGGSGIGYSLSKMLIDLGASVYVAGRNQKGPEGSTFLQVDITNYNNEFDALPDTLHGLAYCPGTINLKPLSRLNKADFEHDFSINVIGAFQSIQAVNRKLKKAGSASIVLFSTVASTTGMAFHASIAASKGALDAMSRSLAAELASSGIRVNTIAPSITDTPLASQLLSSPEKIEASAKRHPLGRVGNPEDTAALALFLLHPQSSWISGQNIGVDGGLSTIR
jgi:3-oxoacyl-[acyl-carrier protein] reductase